MATRQRRYKLYWRSKRASHGKKPCHGRIKSDFKRQKLGK